MPSKGRLTAGIIKGPHGLKGEVRMASRLAGNIDLETVEEVFLATPDGHRRKLRLLGVRRGARNIIARLEGVNNPEDAAALKGCALEIDASLLPPAQPGEYYLHDLVGMEVRHIDGETLGKVTGFIPRDEQDLLEIKRGQKEYLIPLVEPIVKKVDLEGGVILIDPPEGLVE